MTSDISLPKIVYHGTFWPKGTEMGAEGLTTDYDYVSATPDKRWAWYFAGIKRWHYRNKSGKLTIYEIDTDKLPQDVRAGCIPPDGLDPRAQEYGGSFLDGEMEMREERIKVGDWRFPYIPRAAITSTDEEYRPAQPDLHILSIARQPSPVR